MKGKDIITVAIREEMPDLEVLREECVCAAQQSQVRRREKSIRLQLFAPLAAACLVCVAFTAVLFGAFGDGDGSDVTPGSDSRTPQSLRSLEEVFGWLHPLSEQDLQVWLYTPTVDFDGNPVEPTDLLASDKLDDGDRLGDSRFAVEFNPDTGMYRIVCDDGEQYLGAEFEWVGDLGYGTQFIGFRHEGEFRYWIVVGEAVYYESGIASFVEVPTVLHQAPHAADADGNPWKSSIQLYLQEGSEYSDVDLHRLALQAERNFVLLSEDFDGHADNFAYVNEYAEVLLRAPGEVILVTTMFVTDAYGRDDLKHACDDTVAVFTFHTFFNHSGTWLITMSVTEDGEWSIHELGAPNGNRFPECPVFPNNAPATMPSEEPATMPYTEARREP
jgi:hypothetical protein